MTLAARSGESGSFEQVLPDGTFVVVDAQKADNLVERLAPVLSAVII